MADPQLMVFAGMPGCGKTSLARALARQRRAVYVDKDTAKACIIATAEQMRLSEGEALAGPASYDLLLALARDNLTLGMSVVLDGPAAYKTFRDQVKQLARAVKADLRLIECICSDEELLRQRIEGRGRDWAAFQRDRLQFERMTERRLVIDTADPLSINLRRILAYLETPAPTPTVGAIAERGS